MTQDEIIRMAREAGFSIKTINSIDGDEVFWFTNITDMLERFASLVAAHAKAEEREACANVCDEEMDDWDYDSVVNVALNNCAAAIRARNNNG